MNRDLGESQSMSTWMVVTSVWMMFAICVVLFVRGASPHVQRSDDAPDQGGHSRADMSRAKL
ncbi:hypothetical protein AWB71_02733 [Caballeronia peredens]|nr:hypothetical protein AWB71_02733 [Caballeronia peredens]